MHIKWFFRMGTQGLHDARSNREIWHIMPVHHINMDHIRPSRINIANGLPERGKICRQNRGGNENFI